LLASCAALSLIVLLAACAQVGTSPSAVTSTVPTTVPASATPLASASPSASPSPSASTYPDGIPTAIDGEPVLRPAQALIRGSSAVDDTRFLVGGWLSETGAVPCPTAVPQVLGQVCPFDNLAVGEAPGDTTLWWTLVNPDGVRTPAAGPVVFRVHAHDKRDAECPPAMKPNCDSKIVIDEVVWTPGEPASSAVPSASS
jgi:hypothetical protein